MAPAAAALLGALALLAAFGQGQGRRRAASGRRISKTQYQLPPQVVDNVRRHFNCSLERRELQSRMRTLKPSCKTSSGIPEGELSEIKQKGPTSQEGKCFLGCMMEGMSIIENGAFARESADRLVRTVYAEGTKRRSAREAVRACALEVTTTDKCETGARIFQCFQRYRVGLFGSGGA